MNSDCNLILKLDQNVINKISAGEVIHRPFNVVKELIENSLDAGATMINVTLKNGGLKQIIVQDNGCGISKENLKIVCNRFTTSKLKSLDDFQTLNTFGFRGEALSSISMVSYLTIVTKTSNTICGYKAEYVDGELKDGDDKSITGIATDDGTIIIVDDLFYNMPQRKAALCSPAQELFRVQELLTKYALIYSGKCGFILKKQEENTHLINTKANGSLFSNIDRLFTRNISEYLLAIDLQDDKLQYKITGHFSNNDLNLKRMELTISINQRLVECPTLKRTLVDIYKCFLMKGGHPFILIQIEINPKHIDVNVHPTKNQVTFLYDNEIISRIETLIRNNLKNVPDLTGNVSLQETNKQQLNQSTLINFISTSSSSITSNQSLSQTSTSQKATEQTTPARQSLKPPTKQVRIDCKLQRLNQYLQKQKNQTNNVKKRRRNFSLRSLLDLRDELNENTDDTMLNLLMESSLVGAVDQQYLLIQHQLDLVLLKTQDFNRELFYQLYLLDFGNFDYIKFNEKGLSLRKLLEIYFELNDQNNDNDQPRSIDSIIHLLSSKRELLDDYFSIKISNNDDQETMIEALPLILENHLPNFTYLPELIHDLAMKVNWKKEKNCFQDVGHVLAKFYSYPPMFDDNNADNDNDQSSERKSWLKLVNENIYPFYKNVLLPTKHLQTSFYIITNVSQLYRVFERC